MSDPAATPSQPAGAFNPRVVLALLVFGAAAFFASLYFIGTGNTGRDINDGGGHASGSGLNGYAALASYLEAQGHSVTRSRSAGAFDDAALLVLTPPQYVDSEELTAIIDKRRLTGPTIIVLPKWFAAQIPPGSKAAKQARDGWVMLQGASSPEWTIDLPVLRDMEVDLFQDGPNQRTENRKPISWSGNGQSGKLPDPKTVQSLKGKGIVPLVTDNDGQMLAGFLDDGYYPSLAEFAGQGGRYDDVKDEDLDFTKYGVVIVAEPDLLDNWGFASRNNAGLADALVKATLEDSSQEGEVLPVVFDMTLNGLGRSKNLLTLAFAPPFLAATICLIIALIAVGWRAFRRFGPPVHEAQQIAFGKSQLVANSAGLIRRAKRFHLLGPPYAALVGGRIAHAAGLRNADDDQQVEAALARRLSAATTYSDNVRTLRSARDPGEILRAARALRSIERMLER